MQPKALPRRMNLWMVRLGWMLTLLAERMARFVMRRRWRAGEGLRAAAEHRLAGWPLAANHRSFGERARSGCDLPERFVIRSA